MQTILLLILLVLPFTAPADVKSEAALQKQWQRPWNRPDAMDSSSLKVTAVTKRGFDFAVEATSGANLGELTGKAAFEPYFLKAKATVNACKVTFSLSHEEDPATKLGPSRLTVATEGDCSEFAASGVEFDGQYLTEGVKPTFTASFDCRWAATEVETQICADELLADADRELARLYAGLESAELKKTQKAWLKGRNAKCENASDRTDCLVEQYAKRLVELQALSKKKALERSAVLFFDEYVKPQLDESRDKLWKDPLARLLLRHHLGQEKYDLLRAHNLYFAEETPKAGEPKEISVFTTIRGTTEKAGIVLTRSGHLWAALPTVEASKWQPLVFGPKDTKIPEPAALKEWLGEAKNAGWNAPRFERVF